MKAIGFNQGQYGDICMNLVACKAFKRDFPESHLTMGINKKYMDIAPIFRENPLIDGIHIWDGYDDWPSASDSMAMSHEKFDKVFDPMAKHVDDFWYLQRHQTEELCAMHGLVPPENLSIYLNRYFNIDRFNKYVAINLFGSTRASAKMPSPQKIEQIVSMVENMGYIPLQIGSKDAPNICTNRFDGSFSEAVRFMLSCDFLITIDSAMCWVASGYSFPTIGLYSYSYYPKAKTSKTWQPINKNAIYIEKSKIDDINDEEIRNAIGILC